MGATTAREAIWCTTLHRLAEFSRENGRMPKAAENDGRAPHLGRWLSDQKSGRGLTPSRAQQLNEQAPGWHMGNQERWLQMLERLEVFMAQHGRTPIHGESDGFDPNLGYWITIQRTLRHMTAARLTLLDERTPGWRTGPGRHS